MRKLLTILTIIILIGGSAHAAYVADPMSIGVGARALGMGKTYVAVAEDGDALFVNPAGLAQSPNPKLSSMYSSLLNDVSYTVIGGVYPYGEKSAIGAGIINSNTSDIILTNADGSPAGTGSWSNTVLFLSAGTYLNSFPAFKDFGKDVLIGGSFKYYSVGGTGGNNVANASDSAGNAYSADLGVLYPVTDYLTLGANWQNIFASKLTRSSGINENLPSTLKVGGKLSLIGKEEQAYTIHNSRRLYLNADYDMISDGTSIPHLGLEFWPVGNLALRTGMDGKDITAGIGVRLAGLEFNYAYHPYSGINENATSFFSISYLGEEMKRMLRVHIDSPADKGVIYDDHVKVSGRVQIIEGDMTQAPAGVISVKVNGILIPVNEDLTFTAEVPVDQVGKKLLVVEASDTAGDYVTQEMRLVRLVNFADVPDGYWAKQPIENTGTVGLIEGYPDGSFRPDRTLTRAELATLLVRAKGLKLPSAASQPFKDVKADFWGTKYIEVAKKEGLVKGYPDGTYRPNNKINKAEGIAILARFENLNVASEVFEKPYWDMEANHWASKYVQAAKEAGMLTFVDRNYLNPADGLPRAEAVEMLSKTTLAGGKINDLYSWEKGFMREYIPAKPTLRGALPEKYTLL